MVRPHFRFGPSLDRLRSPRLVYCSQIRRHGGRYAAGKSANRFALDGRASLDCVMRSGSSDLSQAMRRSVREHMGECGAGLSHFKGVCRLRFTSVTGSNSV